MKRVTSFALTSAELGRWLQDGATEYGYDFHTLEEAEAAWLTAASLIDDWVYGPELVVGPSTDGKDWGWYGVRAPW